MRWLPRTIVGRAILVLVVAILAWEVAAGLLFWNEHRRTMENIWGGQVAERIADTAAQVAAAPANVRAHVATNLRERGFRVDVADLTPLPPARRFDWRLKLLDRILSDRLGDAGTFAEMRVGIVDGWSRAGSPPSMGGFDRHPMYGRDGAATLLVSLQLDDGRWLNMATRFEGLRPVFPGARVLPLLLVGLAILGLVVWAAGRATRPLRLFAAAAERLGRDVNAPPLPEDGPREVRRAARAFNRMQERLAGHIRDRTRMLAAVSHDLRTPITRLRLRAELIEDEEVRTKTLRDLAEMEAMIAATLSFARDDDGREETRTLDLAALLQTLTGDQVDAGFDAAYDGPDRLEFEGRPLALSRAFSNLIGNGVKYGKRVRVHLRPEDEAVRVTIDDDGPGIPDDRLEQVFQPFYRLEPSRNRDTGGAGLGLSVVRSVVTGHGGTIRLENRPEGGLRATVVLPTGRA